MPRKYLASYKSLARKRGYKDPLQYIWEQYEHFRKEEKHAQALELALTLLPYGHGKVGNVDNKGETITPATFELK